MAGRGFMLVMIGLASSMPAVHAGMTEISPFTEEALQRGLLYEMADYPQPQGFDGQGTGLTDLDGDGDPDIVVIGAASGQVGIFENLGDGTFADRSVGAGIPNLIEQEGFAAADYDADGLIDLYLTQDQQPNLLLKNLGSFQFQNVTLTAGVGNAGPGTGASWGDYDGDGWLDLYVCNYSDFAPGSPPNVLYRNRGDGTFEETGALVGVDSTALSFQSVWHDYDRDGDKDLYVSNDRGPVGWTPNQLWRNDGGVFTNVSAESGADVSLFSMGLAVGDFDGNLYPDLYVTDLTGTECPSPPQGASPTSCQGGDDPPPVYEGANRLLLNQTDGTFIEAAEQVGVAVNLTGWGAIFFDFDNNGYKDLYVNNMWMPNSMFANDGTVPCPEIAEIAGVQASFDPLYDGDPPAAIASYSSAVGDVDGDGAIDLLVNNVGDRLELFINHEGAERNFLRYNVVGEYPNLHAVGTIIETTVDGVTHFDESYAGGNGYLGQNELTMHVGLGQATTASQTVVRWPSGGPLRVLANLPANETWTVYPPSRLCDVAGDGVVGLDDFQAFVPCHESGFVPGCEMFDVDGNSSIDPYDMEPCFDALAVDCNANGMTDLMEILFDPGIDADDDGTIDCCSTSSGSIPAAVGSSLVLTHGPAGVGLTWAASVPGGGHDAASSYDVIRSTATANTEFELLTNTGTPAHVDAENSTGAAFYVVSARNGCGSSGEEPY